MYCSLNSTSFNHSFIPPSIHVIHACMHSLVHSFIRSFICSFNRSLMCLRKMHAATFSLHSLHATPKLLTGSRSYGLAGGQEWCLWMCLQCNCCTAQVLAHSCPTAVHEVQQSVLNLQTPSIHRALGDFPNRLDMLSTTLANPPPVGLRRWFMLSSLS